jgi:hypothetical protein
MAARVSPPPTRSDRMVRVLLAVKVSASGPDSLPEALSGRRSGVNVPPAPWGAPWQNVPAPTKHRNVWARVPSLQRRGFA